MSDRTRIVNDLLTAKAGIDRAIDKLERGASSQDVSRQLAGATGSIIMARATLDGARR